MDTCTDEHARCTDTRTADMRTDTRTETRTVDMRTDTRTADTRMDTRTDTHAHGYVHGRVKISAMRCAVCSTHRSAECVWYLKRGSNSIRAVLNMLQLMWHVHVLAA